ncbi:MAG: DegT/DnrJ/EryC1/StrS family aminotransferase [Magnetococcales bacterium]|nr:DegT/DnrJ/EryC1/StrS family aminotransferase [Magnetococcales bacterium]
MDYHLSESSWGDEEIQAIHEVIAGNRFTMGEKVLAFENAFAAHFGMRHAVMVNSGSSANLVAVAALFYKKDRPLQRGDEVIVPAISWSTTFYPLQQYGLRLRFVDVELDTLNMDVSRLEEALTPATRMVVGVSILGNPAALDTMRDFCDRHGLYFLEDNCESMGAELNGQRCGTFGDLTTHSLFFSHHIATMEGGVIMTNDDELWQLCLSLRNHGWTRGLPEDSTIFEKRQDDFFEAYRFILPGYNVRPLELSGAIGLPQLAKLDGMVAARRANGQFFQQLFQGDSRFILQRENGKSSWFSFTVILNPEANLDRRRILTGLKEAGVEFRIITGGNFLQHDVIKYFDYTTVGPVVNAPIAHNNGFFVGNYPRDACREIAHFHRTISELAG